MNNPKLYAEANSSQKAKFLQTIKKYKQFFQFGSNDKILDIGCGNGDVSNQLTNYANGWITGIDISPKMIQYASETHQNKRLNFQVLDIAAKQLPEHLIGQFDHIVSFYCLHWVKDQRQAYSNIKHLLKPGGDILALFVSECFHYELYKILGEESKWAEYMHDYDTFCPQEVMSDTFDNLSQLLAETNLQMLFCTTEDNKPMFQENQSRHEFKDFLESINPFIERIPVHLRTEYLEELTNTAISLQKDPINELGYVEMGYKTFMLHARKPEKEFLSNSKLNLKQNFKSCLQTLSSSGIKNNLER